MAKMKKDATEGLNEEYYQINTDILGSFNKFRPPLDLFLLKEDVVRLLPFYKQGGRLTSEQVEQLPQLANDGLIFVSRKDHSVYVKHISYQLDLVLIDKNLQEKEIADIFTQALTRRMEEFLEQPVKPVFEKALHGPHGAHGVSLCGRAPRAGPDAPHASRAHPGPPQLQLRRHGPGALRPDQRPGTLTRAESSAPFSTV